MNIFSLLKKLILFLVFLIFISFGISNKSLIYISLWPLEMRLQTPIYFLFFASVIIGIFIASCYYFFKSKKQ
ncbi:MAG: hypothetical protein CMP36_02080 [Rickettsiales bacterium]|nr:hypothetical protein [Rickettsiales bacterium]OUV80968.1 MAG: hypothetical protein CBC91_02615 [Rickettsiales bacterium TMED131]